MENKKLSRRQRAKLRQRQEMLGGALTLFSGKGYPVSPCRVSPRKPNLPPEHFTSSSKTRRTSIRPLSWSRRTGSVMRSLRPLKNQKTRLKNSEITSKARAQSFGPMFPSFVSISLRPEEQASTSWRALIGRSENDMATFCEPWPRSLKAG